MKKIMSNKEWDNWERRTLLMEIILFFILTITIGYALLRVGAYFYLKELQESFNEFPVRTYVAAGDYNYGDYDYPIIYISDNSIKGVLMNIPAIETEYVAGIKKNSLLYFLAKCESSLNPEAVNPDDPNGGSFGLFQFQKPTFKEYCVDKYELEDDIFNPAVQIECAKRMLSEGLLYHWSCSEKI